ncbi:GNAT family N-acetyltransferase [Pseudomonas sp. B21-051]|uniref:GNAT family N-acetyltransferase n=1 Tax=Pseudomonas sp. B21-051 TaxID=2895491 RepID=UPI00215DEB9D|nr:GNAT family N-acetyltransferase [Pseudomonas sp. B21-051]UVK86029.1 GNAT family N-acetyltransferase [Pseudomonas sp. B21-051]
MKDKTTLRRYRITDAPAVSGLFGAIYGTHYPQPHVYLPCMISQNHNDGRWHSLVAVLNEQIRGHATLFRQSGRSSLAELALTVVHPDTRGQNIATQLGRQLLIHAQALDCRGVTIKQVTHHLYTQRMAASLGFYSCGLLPDYAPSPFDGQGRETIVVGLYNIDGFRRPLPALAWPTDCGELVSHLERAFGTTDKAVPWRGPKVHVEHDSGRYDIVLKELDDNLLRQLERLPVHWLVSIRLRLAKGFPAAIGKLAEVGFAFTGIVPDERSDGWLGLFHRGYQPSTLTLHCPHMQRLQDQARQAGELYRG